MDNKYLSHVVSNILNSSRRGVTTSDLKQIGPIEIAELIKHIYMLEDLIGIAFRTDRIKLLTQAMVSNRHLLNNLPKGVLLQKHPNDWTDEDICKFSMDLVVPAKDEDLENLKVQLKAIISYPSKLEGVWEDDTTGKLIREDTNPKEYEELNQRSDELKCSLSSANYFNYSIRKRRLRKFQEKYSHTSNRTVTLENGDPYESKRCNKRCR